MGHSFLQKLVLVLLAGAITAGLYEFYKEFIVGSLESSGATVPAHYNYHPAATPRRF